MLKNKYIKIVVIFIIFTVIFTAVYFVFNEKNNGVYLAKKIIAPEVFENRKALKQSNTVNPPAASSRTGELQVLNQWRHELIESEKKRVKLFYNSTTDFSSELCFKIDKLPPDLVADWDQKLDLILSENKNPDTIEKVNELRDFIHWGKDNDTGREFRTRVVTVSLKTGPGGEDNWIVTVSEADEATGGSADGRNWTRLTGSTRMSSPSQTAAKSRYGHLFVFGDEK